MSWTKRQFVVKGYSEILGTKFVFNLNPEMLQDGLWSLDAMMATWNGKGIRLGYPLPSSPENSDLDTKTNVPDSANEAIYKNLAIRLAPGRGKVVSQDTKITAREGFNVLMARAAQPLIKQFPSNTPRGAGNKPHRTGRGEYFHPHEDECC